jgi:hypothetical protein
VANAAIIKINIIDKHLRQRQAAIRFHESVRLDFIITFTPQASKTLNDIQQTINQV